MKALIGSIIFFLISFVSFAQISIIQKDSASIEILPNGIRGGLPERTSDTSNIALGKNALLSNINSHRHIAIGINALKSYNYTPQVILDPDFSSQIAIGYGALARHNPAIDGANIAIGTKAMGNVTFYDAGNNISIGQLNMQNALPRNVISIGHKTLTGLQNNQNGETNETTHSIYIGNEIGLVKADGDRNTVIGHGSFRKIAGSNNTILGFEAGYNLGSVEGSNGNVLIGSFAGRSETGNDKLYIEHADITNPLIGGDFFSDRVGINREIGLINSINRTLQVEGTALITDTLQLTKGAGNGKILTSDALGNASWQNSASIGGNWQVVGSNSARGGFNNNISDGNSNTVLVGESNNSGAGQYMYGMGWGLELQGFGTSVIGMFNTIPDGTTNTFSSTDPLFIIGNGQSNAIRSNALVIQKNGVMNLGILPGVSSTYRLRVGGGISSASNISGASLRANNLNGSGERQVCTDANGNLIECSSSSASAQVYNVSAMGFQPIISNPLYTNNVLRDVPKCLISFSTDTKSTEAYFNAPVELPQGFNCQALTLHYKQNIAGGLTLKFFVIPKQGAGPAAVLASITTNSILSTIQEKTVALSNATVIDNENFYYYLTLDADATWKGSNLALRGVIFSNQKK